MHDAFLAITFLTLGAAALVWLLQRFHMSPIIAYILLGVLAGPFKGWLFGAGHETSETVTELAIILLMFFIGLEFHLQELRANLKLLLLGGTLQVGISAVSAGVISTLFGTPFPASAILGLMVAFSSTALVFKAFEDRRESDSQRSRVALLLLVFQDLAAILIVSLLPLIKTFSSEPDPAAPSAAMAIVRFGALFLLLPLLFFGSRWLLPRAFSTVASTRTPEIFSLLSLGACLSVALAAHVAGASLALGAFLGGLVLCQTPFASQILADLSTLRNLALAFFFVTIGMLVDLSFVWAHAVELAGALIALLGLKTLLTTFALRLTKTTMAVSAGVGLALAQIGEFSFVLGREAMSQQLLSATDFQFLLSLALLSMLATPFLVQYSGSFGRWCAGNATDEHAPPHVPPKGKQVRAIVVGYGPVGRTLTRILKDFGLQPVIIDMNIETVKKLTASDHFAIFGDAGRREILRAAGVETAAFLLVTLPDLPGRIPVVATARMMNPNIKILTRARYLAEHVMLEDAGATAISYEEAEVAVGLAWFLLREIGAPEEDFEREADRIRNEIAVRTGFSVVMPSPVIPPKG